ncbi:MAG TPA: AAA family ATPase [Ktedonobacterales bacterium]
MNSTLLERDQCFEQLTQLWHTATTGQGRIVLVRGEAGIGKTALVEQFVTQHCQRARRLWGACDALFTPRPLGPLYDMAAQVGGTLASLLRQETPRPLVFSSLLDELQHGSGPAVVVIEDVHWADEATLDLIKFLGRRVARLSVLLILTYRDDELGRDHPLRLVLGDLTSTSVARLSLLPLSQAALTRLAPQSRLRQHSAQQLYAITGGNPFFVTEVLASDTPEVPSTVRDAVLARVARLSRAARALLELVSVVPIRIERWLLGMILDAAPLALEECFSRGMLIVEPTTVAFRHELARLAVESTLSPLRRQTLHAQVLQGLLAYEGGVDPSQATRLVYHATGARNETLIARYAPLAARHASVQGAHRAAAEHYRAALRYADLLEGEGQHERHAELLDGLAQECALTSQTEEALQVRLTALALWQRLGRPERVGQTLHRVSNLCWRLGRREEADRYMREAVALLETLPPSRELGQAYARLSSQHMVAANTAEALVWGRRALEVAKQCHDAETECYARFSIGSATFGSGDERGREMLEQSLQMAREQGFEEIAALANLNLANAQIRSRAYAQAMGYLEEGLAYCKEHDLDGLSAALRAERARAWLDQGEWAGAGEEANAILSAPSHSVSSRIQTLLVLGLVRARRGDPGAEAVLDEARALALGTTDMQDIAPVAAARAEWQWLQGNREQCAAEAAMGFQVALRCKHPWYLGEVAIWLWREGVMPVLPEGAVAPSFAAEMLGDWQGAAALWEQLGCPYEQALALAEGDAVAQRQALALFDQLGAQPPAACLRQRMRTQGRSGIPRGPRSSTRSNQAGLTSREMEVVLLLAESLSNAQIARRLSTSPKTVDHHVSAILSKLDVRSRAQVSAAALALGLLPHPTEEKAAPNAGNALVS